MKERKDCGFFKAACLMLTVMMLAVCVISGTLAKYRSIGTVNPTLTVATWSFKINEEETTFPNIIELSTLTWTVKPTEPGSDSNENTIAPGTWGYAPITVKNVGDVDAFVSVSIEGGKFPTEDSAGNNIQDTLNKERERLTFAIMEAPPENEGGIKDDSVNQPYQDTLVRNGKSGKNSITFYLVYKWEFGTVADAEYDNMFQGNFFTFGSLTITARQIESTALALSQPTPTYKMRSCPTPKTDSEVMTDE